MDYVARAAIRPAAAGQAPVPGMLCWLLGLATMLSEINRMAKPEVTANSLNRNFMERIANQRWPKARNHSLSHTNLSNCNAVVARQQALFICIKFQIWISPQHQTDRRTHTHTDMRARTHTHLFHKKYNISLLVPSLANHKIEFWLQWIHSYRFHFNSIQWRINHILL